MLLSGCINTLASSHQLTLINMMGMEKLETIYESSGEIINKNDTWHSLKNKMKHVCNYINFLFLAFRLSLIMLKWNIGLGRWWNDKAEIFRNWGEARNLQKRDKQWWQFTTQNFRRVWIYVSKAKINKQITFIWLLLSSLNMVQYKDWSRSNLSEEDYCLYWKTIFNIMFRGKDILMRQ